MFDLVQTSTKDDLILSGLLLPGDTTKPVVINIHGFEGDFFTYKWILDMAKKLQETDHAFLTVQTRGLGSIYEFDTTNPEVCKKIGGNFEVLSEAYLDIDAWIQFLISQGYQHIILQGHSLGTFKVVRYLFEGSLQHSVEKLILLAPFDKTALIEKITSGKWKEYVQEAQTKIVEGKGREIVLSHFEEIAISYQTYVSWYEDTELSHMFDFFNKIYNFPILNKITIPVKVIVGSKDQYFHLSNPDNYQEALDIMQKNIKNFSGTLIPNSKHGFHGYEDVLVKEVVEFVKN